MRVGVGMDSKCHAFRTGSRGPWVPELSVRVTVETVRWGLDQVGGACLSPIQLAWGWAIEMLDEGEMETDLEN